MRVTVGASTWQSELKEGIAISFFRLKIGSLGLNVFSIHRISPSESIHIE
jgi:hypothetical protein